MSMTFAKLKSQKNTYEQLQAEIEKTNKKVNSKDERFWYPETDKAGNGSATIRFLPPSEKDGTEAKAFVKVFSYGFKGPSGQWYIENSPSTIGLPCPMMEHNSKLWAEGKEDEVRSRSRKTQFISNVLVVSDPANPENNGKVFLFKYGKKIFDKIQACSKPEFPDDPKFDPFNFWEGATFKIKIKKVAGYRNYDSSVFEAPSQLFSGDEAKLEKLWKAQYSLNEFVSPSQYKSYVELKKRLDEVLGTVPRSSSNSRRDVEDELDEDEEKDETPIVVNGPRLNGRTKVNSRPTDDEGDDQPPFEQNIRTKGKKAEKNKEEDDDDEDDVDSLFKSLTED